jgi:N-acetylmuramoyl-L-alanine amidase
MDFFQKLLLKIIDFFKLLFHNKIAPEETPQDVTQEPSQEVQQDLKKEEENELKEEKDIDMYLEKKVINLLTLGKKNRPGNKIKELKALVIHWIGPYSNQEPKHPRDWWESESVYGSAHYIVGKKGEIMFTIPENEIGYHIGSTQIDPKSKKIYTDHARKLFGEEICKQSTVNYYAIGIETIPIDNEPGTFSQATLDAASELCIDILIRNNLTVNILTTHYELTGWKLCPQLWAKNPKLFVDFKKKINKRLPKTLQISERLILQNY